MQYEVTIKRKRGKSRFFADNINKAVEYVRRNPFYFFDIEVVECSSLFHDSKDIEVIENPFFE